MTVIGDRDETIRMFTELDGKLIAIKDDSIHSMYFPDNDDLQQPTLTRGTNSEVVARTFVTAALLFDKRYLTDNVDINGILNACRLVAEELIELEQEIEKYQNDLTEAIDLAKSRTSRALPHIANLHTRCKTIIQKAFHVTRTLRNIGKAIFQDKIDTFEDLANAMIRHYGNDNNFGQFLLECVPFMHTVQDVRNGLDHDLPSASVQNFRLGANLTIIPPTIKSHHGTNHLREIDLSQFLRTLRSNLLAVAEAVIAGLASGAVKTEYPHYQVCDIPEDIRRYPFVRYSICSETPVGPFYHQK